MYVTRPGEIKTNELRTGEVDIQIKIQKFVLSPKSERRLLQKLKKLNE